MEWCTVPWSILLFMMAMVGQFHRILKFFAFHYCWQAEGAVTLWMSFIYMYGLQYILYHIICFGASLTSIYHPDCCNNYIIISTLHSLSHNIMTYWQTSNISALNPKTWMFLISPCNCICPTHWSQVLSQEWRCRWSSAGRCCSNYIWVINNFITY